LAFVGSYRLEGSAKTTCRDDDLKEDFWDQCATKQGNNLQALAARSSR
jgi:hypothetical protein